MIDDLIGFAGSSRMIGIGWVVSIEIDEIDQSGHLHRAKGPSHSKIMMRYKFKGYEANLIPTS